MFSGVLGAVAAEHSERCTPFYIPRALPLPEFHIIYNILFSQKKHTAEKMEQKNNYRNKLQSF